MLTDLDPSRPSSAIEGECPASDDSSERAHERSWRPPTSLDPQSRRHTHLVRRLPKDGLVTDYMRLWTGLWDVKEAKGELHLSGLVGQTTRRLACSPDSDPAGCWIPALLPQPVRQEGPMLALHRQKGAAHVQAVRERGRGPKPVSPTTRAALSRAALSLSPRPRPSSEPIVLRRHRSLSDPSFPHIWSCPRYDADVRSRLDRIEHLLSSIVESPAASAKLASGSSGPRPTLTVSTSPGAMVASRALGRGSHTDGSEDGGRAGDGSLLDDEEQVSPPL